MAPAMHERPLLLQSSDLGQPVITVIGLTLQEASVKAVEELLSEGDTATGGMSEQHDRRTWAAMAAVVGDDCPEVALLRLATPGIEHWCRGFVHQQTIRRGPDGGACDRRRVADGSRRGRTSCPASPDQAECLGARDLGLTVKRRMVTKLGDDHMRKEGAIPRDAEGAVLHGARQSVCMAWPEVDPEGRIANRQAAPSAGTWDQGPIAGPTAPLWSGGPSDLSIALGSIAQSGLSAAVTR